MRKIIHAFAPFLIYSACVAMFYFIVDYVLPKGDFEITLFFMIIIMLLYKYVGTFFICFYLGFLTQKRLGCPNIWIAVLLTAISFGIMAFLDIFEDILWHILYNYHLYFMDIKSSFFSFDTKFHLLATVIPFFAGEIIIYIIQKLRLKGYLQDII
jgi:hypothetical protein